MRTIQHLAVAAGAGGLAATYLFHVGVESGWIRLAGALAFAAVVFLILKGSSLRRRRPGGLEADSGWGVTAGLAGDGSAAGTYSAGGGGEFGGAGASSEWIDDGSSPVDGLIDSLGDGGGFDGGDGGGGGD